MRKIYLLIMTFLVGVSSFAQYECGTEVTPRQKAYLERTRDARQNFNAPSTSKLVVTMVPLQVHILRSSAGTGGLSDAEIASIINEMNSFYVNANMEFFQCNAINYIDNDTYYDYDANDENTLASVNDVSNVINVYFANTITSATGTSLCGYSRFPPSVDRIFMANSCAINGSTMSHEMGHYFSLYHTHGKTNTGTTDELVNGSNCTTAGDDICDTPADPNLSGLVTLACVYTGSATDANGQTYVPDPNNVMSYSVKACRTIITTEQFSRVAWSLANERNYLACATPPPAATYCIPTYTSGVTDGDFIDGVALGTINNIGTGSLTGLSYNDYSAMSTDLLQGSSQTLYITAGTYPGDEFAAWIDYNQDSIFDASEKLGEITIATASATQSINFTVPAAATPGNARMRVRCAYNAAVMDPCNNYGWGETEDYTVQITAPMCNTPTITTFPYNEDFELFSVCSVTAAASCTLTNGWTNETSDDIDWTTNAGGTSSLDTGPSADFNPGTATGKYLYTESSATGGFPNMTAIATSPCFNLTSVSNTELVFSYHMYGSDMGELNVEVTTDGVTWNNVWSLSGDQTNNWYTATVDLSWYDGQTVKIRFRGITGTGYNSDIAIDDVIVQEASTDCVSNAVQTIDSKIDRIRLVGNSITIDQYSAASTCETYTDYSSVSPADLTIGGAYTIEVTQGTCGGEYLRYCNVWIDFNNNGSYLDAGEMISTGNLSSAISPFTYNIPIIVPVGAVEGNTSMRVVLKESGAAIDPCATYNWGETEDYTVNIVSPIVNFNTSSVMVNENVGTITLQVDIVNPNANATTVEIALGASTATSGVDFSYSNPTTVLFPAGSSTSQLVTLSIIDDALVEGNENIVLNLQNASNSATIGTASQHTITIIDNDVAASPEVSFNTSSVSVNESAGTITVQVDIASPNSTATTVEVALGASTATSGVDFSYSNPTTVFFPAGSSTSQSVTLSIIDDAVVEGNENIVLNLQNTTNSASIGTTSQHTITIIDNDVAASPEVNFNTSSVMVNENVGTITVQVDIANPNANATTVEVALGASTATSGVDFSYSNPTTVFFPAGSSTSQSVTLSIIDDAVVEGNENIVLNLQNTTNSASIGTASQHTITIIDNDVAASPEVSFNASSVSVNESAGTITVQVDIASPNSNATTVEVALGASTATSGVDFSYSNPTTVLFPGGSSTSQSVTLSIIDDAVVEGNENIVLNLQNTTNGATLGTTSQHTITIIDNDQSAVPVLTFEFGSLTVNEYDGTFNFEVNILSPNNNATSVDVVLGNSSAINGIDFVYYTTQTIVFPAGSSASQSFSFSVIDDAQTEGNENVVFYFQNATNGAVFGTNDLLTITIIDDESVGIDETSQDFFIVYPNPTQGQFIINFTKQMKASIEISNNLGQLVMEKVINGTSMEFDLGSENSRGIYYIKVFSLEGKLIQLAKILYQ